MNRERLEVSVVVPVLNEESNLCLLYEGIMQALAEKYSYEIIFIDDGSTDKSFTVLSHLQKTDSKIRIIRFCRHFGQTAAL
ncbi:MAG: glycosyltransferase, partial [Deltaproteobacteria bacterium]|nr:glycosyltransferase [Deltaproteobacteria bacterium]